MRTHMKSMIRAIAGAILLALAAPAPGYGQEPGPVIAVVAELTPCLTIELSDNAINFHADQGPGVYDADKQIDVSVATNYGTWTVNCSASPLVGAAGDISPDQVFTSNNNTLSSPDVGAGATYESMDVEKLLATGGPQPLTVVNTLHFRLKTDWTDRPGQYTGTISLTYLATP